MSKMNKNGRIENNSFCATKHCYQNISLTDIRYSNSKYNIKILRNHISEIDKLQISWKYKLHIPRTIFATTYLCTEWFTSLLVIHTLQHRYIAQNLYNGIPPQLQIINTLYIYLRIPSIIQSRCSRCGTHKFK